MLNTLAYSLATLRTTDLLTLSYQLYKRLTEIRFVKYDFFGQHSTFFTDSFPILFLPKTARMGGTETQAVWGQNERDKDPFPSLIPPLFWSTAPGVDDWRRVSFQLSLSTAILNKCINAILTINCSQAFDNTIHFVMKKKRKKKKEERRVLRLLHLELLKLN